MLSLPAMMACGGGSSSSTAAAISVQVTPGTVTLPAGGSQQFTAAVTGSSNAAVQWSVLEGSAGGTVTPSGGLYTAPSAAGTYHVVAASSADTNQQGTATVTVTAAPALSGNAGPFSQYEMVGVQVAHATLTPGTILTGTIDGTVALTLEEATADQLVFYTPVLSDGNHTLTVTLDGAPASWAFQTLQITPSLSALDMINQASPAWSTALASAQAAAASAGNTALATHLQGLQTSLDQLPSQIATLSQADQDALALALASNLGLGTAAPAAAVRMSRGTAGRLAPSLPMDITSPACDAARGSAWTSCRNVFCDFAMMIAGAGGYFFGPIGALVGTLVLVPAEVNLLARDMPAFGRLYQNYIQVCKPGQVDTCILDTTAAAAGAARQHLQLRMRRSAGADTVNPGFNFTAGKALDLTIETTYTVHDPDLVDTITRFDDLLSQAPALLASQFSPINLSTAPVQSPGSDYSIGTISDPNIVGTPGAAGLDLALSFSFIKPPADVTPVPFTFTLVDSRSGNVDTLNATLKAVVDETLSAQSQAVAVDSTDLFEAVIKGVSDTSVTWEISGGTMAGSGTDTIEWTAPATPGTYTITAVSNADPTVSQAVTVTVGDCLPDAAGCNSLVPPPEVKNIAFYPGPMDPATYFTGGTIADGLYSMAGQQWWNYSGTGVGAATAGMTAQFACSRVQVAQGALTDSSGTIESPSVNFNCDTTVAGNQITFAPTCPGVSAAKVYYFSASPGGLLLGILDAGTGIFYVDQFVLTTPGP